MEDGDTPSDIRSPKMSDSFHASSRPHAWVDFHGVRPSLSARM